MDDHTFEGQIKALTLDTLVTVNTRAGARIMGGVAPSPDDALTLMVTKPPIGVEYVTIRLSEIEHFQPHLSNRGNPLGLFIAETGHTFTADLATADQVIGA